MTTQELLSAYAAGQRNFAGLDLKGAFLRGASFEKADLEGADLEGADLCGVNLRDANLEGANFTRVYFEEADLKGANTNRVNFAGSHRKASDPVLPGKWVLGGCHYVSSPDCGSLASYALASHKGHLAGKSGDYRSSLRNPAGKAATRRIYKRRARAAGKALCLAD